MVKENEVLDEILEGHGYNYEGTHPVVDAARMYKRIQISENHKVLQEQTVLHAQNILEYEACEEQ